MPEPRCFGRRQRIALWLLSGGYCQACGIELERAWHADHVQAWSRGGDTDVINGRALCPACNILKGARPVMEPSQLPPLVEWQTEFLRKWNGHTDSNFLLVAWPGAGKTIAALQLARDELLAGTVRRVIMVSPTDSLRTHWDTWAGLAGLRTLGRDFDPSYPRLAKDVNALALTYQQVLGHSANIFRGLIAEVPTLVILDEPHHMGDTLAWATAATTAFSPARWRLLLTGTPYRHDGLAIPFVEYVDGCSRIDYAYSYVRALRDKRCRHVVFQTFEGQIGWLEAGEADEKSVSFGDKVSQVDDRRRLRVALDPSSGWLTPVLHDAVKQLAAMRDGGHADAGGLVLTSSYEHAVEIADALALITGVRPALITSHDPDAALRLAEFASSSQAWAVAIRMIAEGVNIPRLRVEVYATVVRTESSFVQAVGRVLRVQKDIPEQTALVYIPKDPVLSEYARKLEEEMRIYERSVFDDDDEPHGPGGGVPTPSQISPLPSPAYRDEIIASGRAIDVDALAAADAYARGIYPGIDLDPRARFILAARILSERPAGDSAHPLPVVVPYADKKRALTDIANSKHRQYCSKFGKDYRAVGRDLKSLTGTWISEATVDQLKQRIAILDGWLGLA